MHPTWYLSPVGAFKFERGLENYATLFSTSMLFPDVVQHIFVVFPTFRGKVSVQTSRYKPFSLDYWAHEDAADRSFRNVGNQLPTYYALQPRTAMTSKYAAEV